MKSAINKLFYRGINSGKFTEIIITAMPVKLKFIRKTNNNLYGQVNGKQPSINNG